MYVLKVYTQSKSLKDSEIVSSSLLILVGVILLLQGWRLDPILLLSQGTMAGIGVYYVFQTLELRKIIQVCMPSSAFVTCVPATHRSATASHCIAQSSSAYSHFAGQTTLCASFDAVAPG